MKFPFRRVLAPRVPVIAAGLLPVTAILGTFSTPSDGPLMRIVVSAPKPPRMAYADLLVPTAHMVGVNPALVKSIARAESAFNPDAVSPKGALGIMQVMPQTAQEMGLDASQPAQNIEAGTRYLKWLLARYSNSRHSLTKVIAAYNAGPGAVDKYRGIPRYRETRSYVARVMKYFRIYQANG